MRTFSILLLSVLIPVFASAEIYKWVDENGRTGFSDKPQNTQSEYYVPKTDVSSFEGHKSRKASDERSINQSGMKSSVNRKSTQELERAEKLQVKSQREYREKDRQRENLRSSPKGKRSFAGAQSQHDRRTNYDGYGSELSRYQNAIIMKTHNSVLKGGNMEYWNGLDDYRYYKQHGGKVRRHRW